MQHINDYKTRANAYEGHYLHYNTSVVKTKKRVRFRKGDLYIPIRQNGIRYLIETLEAEGVDSFFNWNFFDTILQQKEGFSGYVFEEVAANFLRKNPAIKKALEEKIKTDKSFANNPRAQLSFVYKKTLHYENAHLMLPVFKAYSF